MDRVQQVLRLAEPELALQNGRALHLSLQASLPAVPLAQAAQAVPYTPQKARREGMRERNEFFQECCKASAKPKAT